MNVIPLSAIASQTFTVVLGGQTVQLNIYSRLNTLYMDVYVNNEPIILGVQCENANRIVRSLYLGFLGDLIFYDTQGADDPFYSGLGTRFQLLYLSTDDLATLGLAA